MGVVWLCGCGERMMVAGVVIGKHSKSSKVMMTCG